MCNCTAIGILRANFAKKSKVPMSRCTMNAELLKALQAPIKSLYRDNPQAARLTLSASGTLDGERIICLVNTHAGPVPAGLHPATGGDGRDACSADMLLQALVGCAGVTLKAVATAL